MLAKEKYGLRERDMAALGARFVPFTAQTRMSGVDVGGASIRKGAVDAVLAHVGSPVARRPSAPARRSPRSRRRCARSRRSPSASPRPAARRSPSRRTARLLGVVHLKDIVKGGIRERFAELRRMGIRTVMITGDNPMTAAAIAAEAGVDDFLAEATPEAKLKLIREEQAKGKLVAMCGDGTNDAPALAQADVGVAMNTGTVAAREAGNMVDLDSDPTKLIEIVEIGKQLLMTRGALTTFSIANDVAKYFAIIPAMFIAIYPQLGALNVMGLATPESAILSAIIFNALIIVALIPLALRGVATAPIGAGALLRRNLARLRPRRPRRALHRHQADRHRDQRHRPRLTRANGSTHAQGNQLLDDRTRATRRHTRKVPDAEAPPSRPRHDPPHDPPHRAPLPARDDRPRPGVLPGPGQRQPDRARRPVIGSALIGQSFASDGYFHGRPSATAPDPTTPPPRPARTSARPTPS